MSKKTKRLEKENLSLTRKQEATNKNIFQMAEERSQSQQTIDRLTRENEKLKKLCRAMQTGGYGGAAGAAGGGPMQHHQAVDMGAEFEGETESEYDDEEYDEDEEGEYDDDTEDEEPLDVAQPPPPRAFGPPPPPPPQPHQQEGKVVQELPNGGIGAKGKGQQQQVNGAAVNGTGTRH